MPVRFGLIGCGRIVQALHVPALKALSGDISMLALADVTETCRRAVGDALHIPAERQYRNFEEMLDQQAPDVVLAALPHHLHRASLEAAAARGIHMLTEKPLAVNLADARAMARIAERAGIHIGIMHNYLYRRDVLAAKALLQKGAIGKPFLIRFETPAPSHWDGIQDYDPSWRRHGRYAGGGCLLDNGYHFIYLAEALMDAPVTRVSAAIGSFTANYREVEDLACVQMEHGDAEGITVMLQSWGCRGESRNVMEIHGEQGSIHLGQDAFLSKDGGRTDLPVDAYDSVNSLEIFKRFLNAVARDAPPAPGLAEGVRVLEIIDAAYRSAREGIKVNVQQPGAPQ